MISREGTRHLPGDNQERKTRPGFRETLRRQFREVKQALIGKALVPDQPTARRRRTTDETGRAFKLTARKIMRRAVRIPAEAYATATAYLSDTLDWLNQWHQHDSGFEKDSHPAPPEHLYPHL